MTSKNGQANSKKTNGNKLGKVLGVFAVFVLTVCTVAVYSVTGKTEVSVNNEVTATKNTTTAVSDMMIDYRNAGAVEKKAVEATKNKAAAKTTTTTKKTTATAKKAAATAKTTRAAVTTTAMQTTAATTTTYAQPEQSYSWNGSVLTQSAGVNYGPSGRETYYNLDMSGVISAMRGLGYSEQDYPYWEREDGAKMLGNYVMVAADLNTRPKGTVLQCSLGSAIVCDTGSFVNSDAQQLDIAVTW